MKKWIAIGMVLSMLTGLCACAPQPDKEKQVRVAVVRNLGSDDHTEQYFDGAVSEGETLGYQVDTFLSGADDEIFQNKVEEVIAGDYDGLILSHGKEEYSHSLIEKAVKNGIKVVTFDTIFQPIEGVTATAQDDAQLARLSLDRIVSGSAHKPARVVKVWYDEKMAPFQKRNAVYEEYEQRGLIQTVHEIYPQVPSSELSQAVSDEIKQMAPIQADYIWAAWDELATGIYASGSTIPMVSIDISDSDITDMLLAPQRWQATAAVNARVIGEVNMRILAQKLKGEKTPESFDLPASLIEATLLNGASRVSNLGLTVESFGTSNAFLQDWMVEEKRSRQKDVALITSQGKVMDESFHQMIFSGIEVLSDRANISFSDNEDLVGCRTGLQELIDKETDFIWGGDGQSAPEIAAAAEKNPELTFAAVDAEFDNPAKNLTGISFRSNEGAFLAGYLAAKTSKTNKIGFVGGADDAVIHQFAEGYIQGAKYASADILIYTDYVGNYADSERGQSLAEAQYGRGADIVFQAAGAAGLGVIEAAKKEGRWAIGVDLDQSYLAPEHVLTSVVKHIDLAVTDLTERFLKGEKIGGQNLSYGLKEGGTGLVLNSGHISNEMREELIKVGKQIINGDITVK